MWSQNGSAYRGNLDEFPHVFVIIAFDEWSTKERNEGYQEIGSRKAVSSHIKMDSPKAVANPFFVSE
jgi:hypothetical protein